MSTTATTSASAGASSAAAAAPVVAKPAKARSSTKSAAELRRRAINQGGVRKIFESNSMYRLRHDVTDAFREIADVFFTELLHQQSILAAHAGRKYVSVPDAQAVAGAMLLAPVL